MNDKYVAVPREDWEDILDSVRGKTGKTALLKSGEVSAEIDGIKTGGDLPEEAFVIKGNCTYRFAYGGWDWFVEQYGGNVVTQDITHCAYMFQNSKVKAIPFVINGHATANNNIHYMFASATNLESLPKMHGIIVSGMTYVFRECWNLRNLPEDIESYFNWEYMEGSTNAYLSHSYMFQDCRSLRAIPMSFFTHWAPNTSYSGNYFYNGFQSCYSLDELVDLPLPYTSTWTSNAFYNTFSSCSRLANVTFAMRDGAPYVMNWRSQLIDLSSYIGYTSSSVHPTNIIGYNSGITIEKRVNSDETYQALKNDPDWFSTSIAHSRYNHDSAVATINSLPDTSAYLATAGGTNTIKFKGAAGSGTDGGAINTLTAEEIAVATAKGWTVTLV